MPCVVRARVMRAAGLHQSRIGHTSSRQTATTLLRVSAHRQMRTQTMTAKAIKLPGADHPIAIEPNPARIVVSVAGRVIADTGRALTLREASYPAVQYIPREDVDMSLLERTRHATYCPYKGDCAYYSIPLGGERSNNAVWC